ncbi:DJ-1/PfpI family protein [Tindallia magadiensis]|uniref:DJ-1/PfpI family protein n=1 Tax=Tindallia magadiensis TaxID=69895 RepID=A0A1I3BBZ8_9FIRM|nr:DJ-1/PfpI family protein [Tindallia magadiensis]SFH59626.1 DJ-1/PfpI family protein [Tindallia magadiensis]
MRNVGIYVFEKVEVLDFAGPYEVFSVTSELNQYELFNVFTIAERAGEIKTVNGLKIIADYSIDQHPNIDILVIPGGEGTRLQVDNEKVLDWIRHIQPQTEMTMSVCSGAVVLGKLGLLDGLESVTHHQVLHLLKKSAPNTIINENKRMIDHGHIATCGGISAGIDLSLHVVKKFHGNQISEKTQSYMEYGEWKNEPSRD